MANQIQKSKAARGQTVVTSHGLDNASSLSLNDKEARMGRQMGGSTTNLKHSLSDDSAVSTVSK